MSVRLDLAFHFYLFYEVHLFVAGILGWDNGSKIYFLGCFRLWVRTSATFLILAKVLRTSDIMPLNLLIIFIFSNLYWKMLIYTFQIENVSKFKWCCYGWKCRGGSNQEINSFVKIEIAREMSVFLAVFHTTPIAKKC